MSEQHSGKSGVASTSRKQANSKHGFDTHPASQPVAGAFGAEDEPPRDELEHATAGGADKVGTAGRTKGPGRKRG